MKREWMCALLLAVTGAARADGETPRTSFTNDDLDRIAPRRGETGVLSTPAFEPPTAGTASRSTRGEDGGERYWRAEAARVRASLVRLRAQADATRARLDKARRSARDAAFRAAQGGSKAKPAAGPGAGTRLAELESDLRALEQQIRAREEELEERARRAGALPGWLR